MGLESSSCTSIRTLETPISLRRIAILSPILEAVLESQNILERGKRLSFALYSLTNSCSVDEAMAMMESELVNVTWAVIFLQERTKRRRWVLWVVAGAAISAAGEGEFRGRRQLGTRKRRNGNCTGAGKIGKSVHRY